MQSEFGTRALLVDKSRKGEGCSDRRRIQGDLLHHVPSPPQMEPQPTHTVRWMLDMKKKHKERNDFSVCNVVCWEEYKTRVRWKQLSSQL